MRHESWKIRLSLLVEDYRHIPFEWGVNDCITFAARAVDAVTGLGVYEIVRAKYHWNDVRSAAKLIANHGGLSNLISEVLGVPNPPFSAKHGDIVLAHNKFDQPHEDSRLVTVRLEDHLVGPGAAGLIAIPVTASRLSWRVG